MALSRIKTWGQEELTYPDLNAEFNNILNNANSLFSPFTANVSMGGYALTGGVSSATLTGVPVIGDLINNAFIGFVTAGTQPTYTLTPTPAMTAYAEYDEWVVKIHSTNTGAATLNISAVGAKNIYDINGVALVGGELISGNYYRMLYDGTQFRVLTPTGIGPVRVWKQALGGSSLDFDPLPTGCAKHVLSLYDVSANDNIGLDIQVKVSSVQTSSYVGVFGESESGTPAVNGFVGATGGVRLTSDLGNAAGEFLNGEIVLFNPDGTANHKKLHFWSSFTTAGGTHKSRDGWGAYTGGVGAVTGLRIIPTAGTLAGTAVLTSWKFP